MEYNFLICNMSTTADGSHTDVQLYTAQQKHAVN